MKIEYAEPFTIHDHVVPIESSYFKPIILNLMRFTIEIDIGFKPLDSVLLREYCPIREAYTGRIAQARICHMTRARYFFPCDTEWVILSLSNVGLLESDYISYIKEH